MSVLSVNGIAVLEGELRHARAGAWVAEVALDGSQAVAGKVTVTSFDEQLRLVGTVDRGGVFADTPRARIVGGAGGLEKPVEPQSYVSMPVRVVLEDILRAGGETLSPTSDAGVLRTVLSNWARERTTVSMALRALLDTIDATWRVLPDGTVWVGKASWPAAPKFEYEVLDEDLAQDRMVLGVDAPALLAGTTFRDRKVSVVRHVVGDAVRTEVLFERDGEGSRLLAALQRLVRRLFSRIDYLAAYPARVVTQNGDLSLELKPESDRLPPLSKVPVRVGIPGMKVKVSAGATVLVTFEAGDPRRPVATLWGDSGLVEVQIGGARPFARLGDSVTLAMPPVIPVQGTLNGAPFVGTMMVKTPLIGSIITGSGVVKG